MFTLKDVVAIMTGLKLLAQRSESMRYEDLAEGARKKIAKQRFDAVQRLVAKYLRRLKGWLLAASKEAFVNVFGGKS